MVIELLLVFRYIKNEPPLLIRLDDSQDRLISKLCHPHHFRHAAMNNYASPLFPENRIRNTSKNTNERNTTMLMSFGQAQVKHDTNLHHISHLHDWITVDYSFLCTIDRSFLSINLNLRIQFGNRHPTTLACIFTGLTSTENFQHGMRQRYPTRSADCEHFWVWSRKARTNVNEYGSIFSYERSWLNDHYAVCVHNANLKTANGENALQLGQYQAKHRYVPYDRGKLLLNTL